MLPIPCSKGLGAALTTAFKLTVDDENDARIYILSLSDHLAGYVFYIFQRSLSNSESLIRKPTQEADLNKFDALDLVTRLLSNGSDPRVQRQPTPANMPQ